MTSYVRKHKKHRKHNRFTTPAALAGVSIPEEPKHMNDDKPFKLDVVTPQIRLELDPKNHSEIQTLILKQAALYRKQFAVGKGRAQIMAEDYVAATYIMGTVDGQRLASWLGNIHNGFRQVVRGLDPVVPQVKEPVQEVAHVPTPLQDVDTFNAKLSRRDMTIDPVLAQLIEKCRPIKAGQVWSFPVKSEDEARALSVYLKEVSKALGWRTGRRTKTFQYQIFTDRLKVKRMI